MRVLIWKKMYYQCSQKDFFAPNYKVYPPKEDYEQGTKVKSQSLWFNLRRSNRGSERNNRYFINIWTICYILIDSRAIQSFISTSFITESCIACEKFDSILQIFIISSRILNTNQIDRAVNLETKGKWIYNWSTSPRLKDFDVIRGMDKWGAITQPFDILKMK